MGAAAAGAGHYRLRGELAGLVRTFPLESGTNTVGSAGDCAVLLPARGVSRRHALVRVDGDGVSVEDEGSRNGTFVAGVAVKRAPVACGDEIRFGPVSLRLECLERGDVELAVELAPRWRGRAWPRAASRPPRSTWTPRSPTVPARASCSLPATCRARRRRWRACTRR